MTLITLVVATSYCGEMATAHGVLTPDKDDQYGQITNSVWWHCYLCRHRSPDLDAAEHHFLKAHPRQWRQWYVSVQRRIEAAFRTEG
jgi:hypothetical protein